MALLVTATAPSAGSFTAVLPADVPNVDRWEKITGEAELDHPRLAVAYEFYVNPKRNALYEVVRYRVRYLDQTAANDYSPNEKLQWDAGHHVMRRFECRGDGPGGVGPCRWHELMTDSPEYHVETSVILWLYGLHRRLLQEREEKAGR